MTAFNELETTIHMALNEVSNGGSIDVSEEDIELAGEQFKEALRKQFKARDEEFRLRMSNIGKPLCQLQKEKSNAPKGLMPYNHVVRMLIGDAVEIIMMAVLKGAGVNITSKKTKVELPVNDSLILGEDDVEIDEAVWDIKSSAPWAFANKWAYGFDALFASDEFGYVAQLYGYAKAKNRRMGGWIVVDKSSGEVKVVPATPSEDQIKKIEEEVSFKESALSNNLPFRRGFEEEVETYFKKPTGNTLIPLTCTFCKFMKDCWPNAVFKPKAKSTAKTIKSVWYAKYNE